ncbi:MAG: sugar ABC transporter substrate-binding protein [Fimbriimonadaceae bacterium]|nr:sugar ABC transporter substrate-binding protein [Fimbriimonadaceae bacterium]
MRALARRPERAELVRRTRGKPLGNRATSKLAHSHARATSKLAHSHARAMSKLAHSQTGATSTLRGGAARGRWYNVSMRALLVLLALIALAGCGARDDDKVVLRIANWSGAGDDSEFEQTIQRIYKRFEEENPGVEIRVEGIPDGYVSKVILSFVAGTEPDIMLLDASSAAVFVDNGVLTDLSPFMAQDPEFDLDAFFPNVVDIARRGDAVYAVPNDFTPMVMYYNKRLFDEAGVPYPQPGWTFADFRQTARALTKKDQYGFAFANWMPGWIMWLWNNGGDVLSPDGKRAAGFLDSPANVETISFLRDLITVDRSAPSLSEAAALGVDLFANGQAAMTVSGHWALIGYANAPKGPDGKPKLVWDDLGVAPMPLTSKAEYRWGSFTEGHTVMYESGYAIGRNSKHKELAWKFLKYFTSYRVQSEYNKSGIAVCACKDVAAERAKDPLEAQFLPIIPTARPPWGAKVEGYEIVEKVGKNALDSVLNNNTPVREALAKAAIRIDQEFAKR